MSWSVTASETLNTAGNFIGSVFNASKDALVEYGAKGVTWGGYVVTHVHGAINGTLVKEISSAWATASSTMGPSAAPAILTAVALFGVGYAAHHLWNKADKISNAFGIALALTGGALTTGATLALGAPVAVGYLAGVAFIASPSLF